MRPTFVFNSECQLVSAIRPKEEAHAVKVGARVWFVRPYMTPYGLIQSGAQGKVESVADHDGALWIKMDGLNLHAWGDKIYLSPFETEDITACVVGRGWSSARIKTAALVASSIGLSFLSGLLVDNRPALALASVIWGGP